MVYPKEFFLLLLMITFSQSYEPTVTIKNGKIRGNIKLDRFGQNFFSFQSIPYAKPPIGELRFKAPQPMENWNFSLDATKESPTCMQFEFGILTGQEDCLFLNVYTPTLDESKKLSVMFFIHGGAYFEGFGSYKMFGPEHLIPENIVLVTINYRLGRFGTLSFFNQSLGVPGNANLKDQVMALKWVQENIQVFGGNPNSVTIFGESAGGASVEMHMLSPLSKGLFHKAISQSGTALSAWNSGVLGTGNAIAKQLGIDTENEVEIIKKLQEMPAEKILDTQTKEGLGVTIHVKFEYSPIIETQTNEPAFLSAAPINILESGNYSKVPYIIGYNNKDSLIFQVISQLYFAKPFYLTDLSLAIPHDLCSGQNKEDILKAVTKEYYGNKPNFSNIDNFTQLSLGAWGIVGFYRSLQKHLETSNTPVYYYVFSGDTKLNYFKRMHPVTARYKGASHIDELGYLFRNEYTPCIQKGSSEDLAVQNIVKLWTNFAKYGNPTPTKEKGFQKWLPVSNNEFNYMDIGIKLRAGVNPDYEIHVFWNNLYKQCS